MQTVKTAAAVVFIVTIMYQAYSALTIPPEPVPEDFEDELIALSDLDMGTGTPESMVGEQSGMESVAPAPTFQAPSQTVNATFADLDATFQSSEPSTSASPPSGPTLGSPTGDMSLQAPSPDASMALSQPANDASSFPGKLPSVSSPNPNVQARGAENYQSTGSTYQTPDPTQSAPSVGAPSMDLNTPSLPGVELPDNVPTISQASAIAPTENLGLSNAIATADRLYSSDRLKEALSTLSLFYNTPNMTEQERSQLLARLDPLAREVVYSKRHLLLQPHRVGLNESLSDIAAKYSVPWKLLANVNGIKDPTALLPGTELKVMQGPFSADVNLSRKELTLFVGDLYAGRFPIEIGNSPAPTAGSFMVQDKSTTRNFYSAQAQFAANDPKNPYGNIWIDLGGQMCIHGSPIASQATNQGCISLAGDYADDLYGILTQGSSVTIRR